MKRNFIYVMLSIAVIMALVLAGCSTTSGQTGQVEVKVTDAPPNADVTSVMVTVSSVQIHMAGDAASSSTEASVTPTATATPTDSNSGWITLKLSGPATFDLLKVKGLEQALAVGDLSAGHYTQIRMEVSNVQVAISGGQLKDATIPSGKLKFVQPFDVAAGKATVILFDFDAARSVNITGGSDSKIMFKPVIKLSVTKTPGNLEITNPALNNGEVGIAYNAALNAIGGTAPYTWSISSGSLPNGLSLNAAGGVISGTPTAAGSSSFTLKADDSNTTGKKSVSRNFTIDIAAAGALQITTTSLADGVNGAAYSATVQSVGGTAPYTWSISSGSLPAGETLNAATGEIAGTPTTSGDFSFTVKVTDNANPANADTQKLILTIAKDPTE